MLSRRDFLHATPAALAGLLTAGCAAGRTKSSVATPPRPMPPKIGRSSRVSGAGTGEARSISTASAKSCRILQVTDLHFFHKTRAEDERTVADLHRLVQQHQPDLVVGSGDLWHDNPEGRGFGHAEFTTKTFSGLGVPWTICWGNHDQMDDYQRGHDLFATAPNSRYGGAGTHGDYRLEVRAPGVSAGGRAALNLFFLNSNEDGLTAWQVDALGRLIQEAAAVSRSTPALAFFHIPILEYETRLTPANFSGLKLEGVSRGKENGGAFPVLSASQTIRACFCGHNHLNDYVVKAGGMDLNYGRSTGYAGYGSDRLRKGAKLIEVDLRDGQYRQTTVFANAAAQFGWRARDGGRDAA